MFTEVNSFNNCTLNYPHNALAAEIQHCKSRHNNTQYLKINAF